MIADWIDKADNPGMAEMGLCSADIYGAVAVGELACIRDSGGSWRPRPGRRSSVAGTPL